MHVRMPVCLSVIVYAPMNGGRSSFCAVSRDISFEGAFIEAVPTRPPKGGFVRLSFETAYDDPLIIDALVIRDNADGFGVMFAYNDDKKFQQLISILQPRLKRRFTFPRS